MEMFYVLPLKYISEGYKNKGQRHSAEEVPG